jgi:hypothetical protein
MLDGGIPFTAFVSAIGVNGLTVCGVAYVLKGLVVPQRRPRDTMKRFISRVATIVIGMLVLFLLSYIISTRL